VHQKQEGTQYLRRSFDEEYLERVRGYGDTEPYRKALRKRQVWVEPLFAEAKDWHGERRFRLRTLEKVNAEALLIAAGQNIKRLLTLGERGPRRLWHKWPPCASRFPAHTSSVALGDITRDALSVQRRFFNSLAYSRKVGE
jgi:hypothetical protein